MNHSWNRAVLFDKHQTIMRIFYANNTFKFHGYDLYCIDRKGKLSLTRKNKETDANKIHAAVNTLNIVYTNTVMWCYVLLFDTIKYWKWKSKLSYMSINEVSNKLIWNSRLKQTYSFIQTKSSWILFHDQAKLCNKHCNKTTEGSKIVSMVITGSSLDYNCILIARIIFLLIPLTILDVCAAWY